MKAIVKIRGAIGGNADVGTFAEVTEENFKELLQIARLYVDNIVRVKDVWRVENGIKIELARREEDTKYIVESVLIDGDTIELTLYQNIP